MDTKILINTGTAFFLTAEYPNYSILEQCRAETQPLLLNRPSITVYGREAHQRRNVGFFSDTSEGYHYSRRLLAAQPLTETLKELLAEVNKLFKADFNGILINEYIDGSDCIGAHSDDESGLDPSAGVVAISLGASRTFRVRAKEDKRRVLDVRTTDGQVMQMGGTFQREFTHEIPAEKKVKYARYSFTFRKHLK